MQQGTETVLQVTNFKKRSIDPRDCSYLYTHNLLVNQFLLVKLKQYSKEHFMRNLATVHAVYANACERDFCRPIICIL